MIDLSSTLSSDPAGVSLVDGEPAVRRARQILLRSQHYNVRSYATCEALLADPNSREYQCIVVDVHMVGVDGMDLLERMRATGWNGLGILLDGISPGTPLFHAAERHGDKVLAGTITDKGLLAAIAASVAVSNTLGHQSDAGPQTV